MQARDRVLVAGVYLADRGNRARSIAEEMRRSCRWQVEQRWFALGQAPGPDDLKEITVGRSASLVPRFVLLNRLLSECSLERYAYLLVCEAAIALPPDFVDRYLELVDRHDLALAQPVRSNGSHIDHAIVEQLDCLDAQRTRFVECGPIFSISRPAHPILKPFDEASPMGCGYDLVWPVILEAAGLRLGIVDATPVTHDLPKPASRKGHAGESMAREAYLAAHPHLLAFSIVEAYS